MITHDPLVPGTFEGHLEVRGGDSLRHTRDGK